MKTNIKGAIFPFVMTIISFILFMGAYSTVAIDSFKHYYYKGLIFAIPFVLFGIISILSAKNILKIIPASIITAVLVPIFIFVMPLCFLSMIIEKGPTDTSDVSQYQNILQYKGYPENDSVSYFPEKIPDDVICIHFRYISKDENGNEKLSLDFITTEESLKNYENEFSQKAKWSGTYAAAQKEGLSHFFPSGTERTLTDDYIIYILPIKDASWLYSNLCYVAISKEKNKIIFQREIGL